MSKYILNIFVITLFLVGSCTPESAEEEAPATDAEQGMSDLITLDPDQVRAIGLETATLARRNLASTVRANGYIDVPPQNKAVISPFVTGYVREVRMLVGDRVRKGEVIAVLESLEYLEMQEDYVSLTTTLEYLKDEFERKQTLQEQNAIARKQLLLARSEYYGAQSRIRGLREKLTLLHTDFSKLETGDFTPLLYIRSPIKGSVSDVTTVIGKHLDPHEEMMEIVNPEHFHLELNVFEKDIMKVAEGQSVVFRIPNLDGEQFAGRIFLVGQSLEQDERYIRVHAHIDDTEKTFKVGMYVNASIAVDDKLVNAVPGSAIVTRGEKKYVFVKMQSDDSRAVFARREVVTGVEEQDFVELTYHKDIDEEDEIVVSGAFYLMNAYSEAGGV